jgi:predicted small lipoprotein YifL
VGRAERRRGRERPSAITFLGRTIDMERTTSIRIAASVLVVLVLSLAVAACGASGPGLLPVSQEDAAADGEADEGSGGSGRDGAPEPEAPSGGDAFLALIEQRIVKTGEISLEVDNVAEVLARVRSLVAELNGYVGGSQAGTLDERATLTVRIPAPAFDTALARLHELDGRVIAETTREENVTTRVVDLQARIDNLRASEASYRELVARAEKIEDILAVQGRLDAVRGEIEQLRAQLDALEGQAALSTLTVTLVPSPQPVTEQAETWNPAAQLDRALASLVGIGQGIADGLIWFVVVWLPILLVLSLFVLAALRGVLEVRRRLPSAPAVPVSGADDGAA